MINRKINDLDDDDDSEDDKILKLDWMDQNYEHYIKIRVINLVLFIEIRIRIRIYKKTQYIHTQYIK